MVQRYSMFHAMMGADEDGDLVKYEDYAALEAKLKSLAHAIVSAGFDPVGSPDFELAQDIVDGN